MNKLWRPGAGVAAAACRRTGSLWFVKARGARILGRAPSPAAGARTQSQRRILSNAETAPRDSLAFASELIEVSGLEGAGERSLKTG